MVSELMQVAEKIDYPLLEKSKTQSKKTYYDPLKRVFDMCFALVLLPFLLPFMFFIAILIKIDSKGPVLFIHKRVGKGGKIFNCLKFRTMVENAEEMRSALAHLNEMSGPVFKIRNDPRTTRLGKFLRRFSIDEFPQIFNILKGEMSFVGPRPPLPEEVEKYKNWHKQRLSVVPGLTCLWQINGRNNIHSFDEWVKMDLKYIATSSLFSDLKIILKTIPAVFSRRGAY